MPSIAPSNVAPRIIKAVSITYGNKAVKYAIYVKLYIDFFHLKKKKIIVSFTFPNDWTPFDNAKKQISQATAKATTNSITRPLVCWIPSLNLSTLLLEYKTNANEIYPSTKYRTKNMLRLLNMMRLGTTNPSIK